MRRIVGVALLAAIALAATAATCVVTHESLTTIGEHDTFAGEMENDSGVDILNHRFRVAFLNSNGAVVETVSVEGCLRSLQDGGSDFFSAASRLPASMTAIGLARMANAAEDPSFSIGEVEDGAIVINEVTAVRVGTTLTIEGTITNNDDDTLEDPVVCATVWNDENRVITTKKVGNIDDLAKGEASTFTIAITVPDSSKLVHQVDVWADGLEDDDPVEPSSLGDVVVTVVAPTATATATVTGTPATSTPVNTATPTATATP
ncbi:MAG: FxLYD domain-containing protein [Dehalococcoidia bacterium]